MHFEWYSNSKFILNAYGRYFWYLEFGRATQVLAAYADNRFVGVLLAKINGELPQKQRILPKLYVKSIEFLQKHLLKGGAGLYEETTKEQLAHYLKTTAPDGEILFLAADPDCGIKGIGTALLNALEEREKGKTLYLFTDNACTYQFYEHRGFERAEEKEIVLKMPKGNVPLTCFLYSKVL